jgi:HEAT repeat protein
MKHIIAFILTVLMAAGVFAQQQQHDEIWLYRQLYDNESSGQSPSAVQTQTGILQDVSRAGIQGSETLFADALRRMISGYRNIRSDTERTYSNQSIEICITELVKKNYQQAANDIYLVYERVADPILKALALSGLGQLKAPAYFNSIVYVLQTLNENENTSNKAADQAVARGAIRALTAYGREDAYLAVFGAYSGWFANDVKALAKDSLDKITDDPSVPLSTIVSGASYSYDAKALALQTVSESTKIDGAKKAEIAVKALNETLVRPTNVPAMRRELLNVRAQAVKMLRQHPTQDETLFPILERIFKQDSDMDMKLEIAACLGTLASDDAVRLLSSFVEDLNNSVRRNGASRTDERQIRALIAALNATGNPAARTALLTISTVEWNPVTKSLASNALKNLNKA